MVRRGAIHFVVVCALAAPSAAVGQEAARPDPDSPAGVEYQLPLDRQREEASDPKDRDGPGGGGTQRDGGSPDRPPLFGEGISPEGGGVAGDQDFGSADDEPAGGGPPGSGTGGGDGEGAGGDRADAGLGGSDASEAGPGDDGPALAQTSAQAGSSSNLAIPGIVLGVLLAGGLLGLALRRGLGPGRQA